MGQLYVVDSADFLFVMQQTGLTQGNLSSHMTKLETAQYIEVHKEFLGKRPRTILELTPEGRTAFEQYVEQMQTILRQVAPDAPAGRARSKRSRQKLTPSKA
jgi:DNA-binding MarR family transcriptional regulator